MNKSITYRGKWIYTPDSRLVEDAYLSIHNNTIQRLTRTKPDGPIVEHDGIILPGLVNAHTHLEFSDLDQPLGQPGTDFVSWIGQVIQYRHSRDPAFNQQAIQSGIEESLAQGTCALGEISTFDWEFSADIEGSQGRLAIVDFRELIGFRPEQHSDIVASADQFLSARQSETKIRGLSPHAPYSVNRNSLAHAVNLSCRNQFPLAMHLAETTDELELLASHRGTFRDLLERLELWTGDNFPIQTTPLDFLQRLSKAHRALIIHGNYLTKDELSFLAEKKDVLKLVFCPRTHSYFQHEPYPLEVILQLGIQLALGTDSRASNPDLSIWNEMDFLYQNHPVHPRDIINMGTLHGARALGLEASLGSLTPGSSAHLLLAPTPEESDFSKAIVRELMAG